MKEQINSISEAFSMQPGHWSVGQEYGQWPNMVKIAKIIEQDIWIDGDPYQYLVGYDDNDNKLFEFKKGTVSIFYKTITKSKE